MMDLTERRITTAIRWTARTIGIALLALIAAFAIGEGVPNPLRGSSSEKLCHVAMLAMLVGQIVAWRREGIGGLVILGGFTLFAVVNHGVPLNIVFGPWLLTGVLYLVCWWREPKAAGVVRRVA
mgnify:CR=1 FL=1